MIEVRSDAHFQGIKWTFGGTLAFDIKYVLICVVAPSMLQSDNFRYVKTNSPQRRNCAWIFSAVPQTIITSFPTPRRPCFIFWEQRSLVEVARQQGIQEGIHQNLGVVRLYQSLELQGNHLGIRVVVRQYLQQVPKEI